MTTQGHLQIQNAEGFRLHDFCHMNFARQQKCAVAIPIDRTRKLNSMSLFFQGENLPNALYRVCFSFTLPFQVINEIQQLELLHEI